MEHLGGMLRSLHIGGGGGKRGATGTEVNLKHSASGSQYFVPSEHISEEDWTTLEKAYGLHTVEESSTTLAELPICERPVFEMLIGATIMVNAITMALEVDLSAKGASTEDRIPWVTIDICFCTFFTGEIVFRIFCLGMCNYLTQLRYLADVVLVAINVVDTSTQMLGGDSSGLQGLTALRLLRLFKIIKILRVVSHIKELNMIAKGLGSALKSLQWVSLMLGLVTFVMAVMFKTLVGRECDTDEFKEAFLYHFGDATEPQAKCEEYWGTVFRCMYTLYQVTTLESWSQVIARPIWDTRPHYVILILAFQLVTTFGLLNIVVAAVVEGTMNSTDEMVVENSTAKETVSHMEILRDIFHKSVDIDSKDSPKEVTQAKLIPLLQDPAIRRKLLLLEIAYDDPAQIFRILDTNERGKVNIKELTQGFMRMRGGAKSKDLMAVRALVYRVSAEVNGKLDTLLKRAAGTSASTDEPSKPAPDLGGDLNGRLDRFEAEFKDQMGMLSEAIALGIPPPGKATQPNSFAESISQRLDRFEKELRGRIGMLEGRIGRLMGTVTITNGTVAQQAAALDAQLPPAPSGKGLNWEDVSQLGSVNTAMQESAKQKLLDVPSSDLGNGQSIFNGGRAQGGEIKSGMSYNSGTELAITSTPSGQPKKHGARPCVSHAIHAHNMPHCSDFCMAPHNLSHAHARAH